MTEITAHDVYLLAQQLSPQEKQALCELLLADQPLANERDPLLAIVGAWADAGNDAIDAFDEEINRSRAQTAQDNPFLALVGGWADMGDDGIDEFNRVIAQIRQECDEDSDQP